VEVLRPTSEQAQAADIQRDLETIEAAVEAGNRDLRSLGFWPVVGLIKRDRVLIGRCADQVGRIDTRAFRAGVRARVRPWVGIVAMVIVALLGVAGVVLAIEWTGTWAGLALLGAGVAWSIGWHVPAHAFVGWLAGIRYTDAFLGGPPPPRPGIKTDYATYLRAEPSVRAWFHASGALATKAAPFVALALWPLTQAPAWAAWGLLVLGVVQIGTDLAFSTKSSDWKKFRRERTLAKNLRRSFLRPAAR
jgi:hypothetical protein